MKKKKIIAYSFAIIIALACIFHQQIGYLITDLTIKNASKITGKGLDPEYDPSKVQPYDAIAAAKAAFQAKDVRANGQIAIPSVKMSLPVYEGLNDIHLYLGAAEHSSRANVTPAKNGNYILASHYVPHKGSLFEPLVRVKTGDKIYVAFKDKVYEYEADNLQQINIYDDSWLQDENEKKLITLYTCVSLETPNLRWVLRGHQTAAYDLDESLPQYIVNSFATNSTLKGTWMEAYEWMRPD